MTNFAGQSQWWRWWWLRKQIYLTSSPTMERVSISDLVRVILYILAEESRPHLCGMAGATLFRRWRRRQWRGRCDPCHLSTGFLSPLNTKKQPRTKAKIRGKRAIIPLALTCQNHFSNPYTYTTGSRDCRSFDSLFSNFFFSYLAFGVEMEEKKINGIWQ